MIRRSRGHPFESVVAVRADSAAGQEGATCAAAAASIASSKHHLIHSSDFTAEGET